MNGNNVLLQIKRKDAYQKLTTHTEHTSRVSSRSKSVVITRKLLACAPTRMHIYTVIKDTAKCKQVQM